MVTVIIHHRFFFLMDTDKLVPFSAVDFRDEKHWWLQWKYNI